MKDKNGAIVIGGEDEERVWRREIRGIKGGQSGGTEKEDKVGNVHEREKEMGKDRVEEKT